MCSTTKLFQLDEQCPEQVAYDQWGTCSDLTFACDSEMIELSNFREYLTRVLSEEFSSKLNCLDPEFLEYLNIHKSIRDLYREVDKVRGKISTETVHNLKGLIETFNLHHKMLRQKLEQLDDEHLKSIEYLEEAPKIAEQFFKKNDLQADFADALLERTKKGETVTIKDINLMAKKLSQK